MTTKERAPGPKGHWLLGNLRGFRGDVLTLLMESVRAHGDVIRFRLGPRVVHLVNHPDHVERVLQRNGRNYDKQTRSTRSIRRVTGESLLTGNGEFWQRQRRLLQPAFHRQSIAGFAGQMTTATAAMLERWRERASAKRPLDVASEMMRLTYTIVARTLFGMDAGAGADRIEQAMRVILPHCFGRLGRVFNSPDWLPTPENLRFHAALRSIDSVVYQIIEQHWRDLPSGGMGRNLLDMLMSARDEESGVGLSREQLRNETLTFLLAGHETTANALTWTFHLLSQHREIEDELRDELDRVLGGKAPALDDLARLPFLNRVIRESMRLYPPVWIIERRVIADDVVDGRHLPAGSAVVVSPYALHRHPAFWDDPETFQPGRFENRPPAAYIPFGAGPRSCIGSDFAMLEAQIITAMVAQAFRLRPVEGHPVEPLPGITLRARHGVLLTLHGANP